MKITAKNSQEFIDQFKAFLKQEECVNKNSIVYLWTVDKPIPRVFGESRILYIGKTINTLSKRYKRADAFGIEIYNFETFYKHVIKKYGGISVEIIETSDPGNSEVEELKSYRKKHLEYPPLNRAIPKLCKLDEFEISVLGD